MKKVFDVFAIWHVQVQHENLQQAEVLDSHGAQLEAMKTDIQDTQKLLSALQSEPPVLSACNWY